MSRLPRLSWPAPKDEMPPPPDPQRSKTREAHAAEAAEHHAAEATAHYDAAVDCLVRSALQINHDRSLVYATRAAAFALLALFCQQQQQR